MYVLNSTNKSWVQQKSAVVKGLFRKATKFGRKIAIP